MIFSARNDHAVVGSGKCASDAIDLATTTRPDVLVVDLNMPGNVFEAIEKIGEIRPQTKIVAFTASPGVDDAMRALEQVWPATSSRAERSTTFAMR